MYPQWTCIKRVLVSPPTLYKSNPLKLMPLIPRSANKLLKLNRNFAVGDRVCQRPRAGTIATPGSPAPMASRRGVVVESVEIKVRNKKAIAGYSVRQASMVQWDGSSAAERVEHNRLIHESEFELVLENLND